MKRLAMRLLSALAVGAALILGIVGIASSASSSQPVDRQAAAQRLIKLGLTRYMTAPAAQFVGMTAAGNRQLSLSQRSTGAVPIASGGAKALQTAGLPNVRVNNPAEDAHQIDQTTQSETAIAVHGSNVAVGFNDSQLSLPFFTAASNLTGYAYSTDGGTSFTDGGGLPNEPEFNNLGDPWLAGDRQGNMYFSNLAADGFFGNLDIGVAKSTDGGKTWSGAAPVYRPGASTFYQADKDAITTGRDPLVPSRDDVYVAWDDFSVDATGNGFAGLPVARSADGGASWQISYADKVPLPTGSSCSFSQYIGANPIVNAANGNVYVAAEKIATVDPNCTGGTTTFSEVIFRSSDGGQTWGPGVRIATVTPSVPDGILGLAPGQYMRNLEFPSLAFFNGALYVAWNDGASGNSHIRLGRSSQGTGGWTVKQITSGANDELQPALSADTALHVMYYRRNADNTLDVLESSTTNGSTFTVQRVTSRSFPGVFTIPQFDPIIAPAYMGDYITTTSDGTHPYFAWGDNRDMVTDFLWPHGRHDPNVYFAKG